MRVRASFLGAHAVPPEFAGDADGYLDARLPADARRGRGGGLADAVDGFCEGIAFSPAQMAACSTGRGRTGCR